MSVLKIIREIFYIIFGIATIVAVFVLEMEGYWILVGLGLIVWGGYDIYKETRDMSSKSEVNQLAKEREKINSKLAKKE